jgi:hypothetical protein
LCKRTSLPQSGWPYPVFPLRPLPDRRFLAGVRVKDLFFGRRGGQVRRPCRNLVRDCENSGKLFPACSLGRSVSRLKAELQRIATSRIAESARRTMQRIVSVILPICVHLRNLRTRNLRLIHPAPKISRSVRTILLSPGLFSAHLTVPGRFSCDGLMINEAAGP